MLDIKMRSNRILTIFSLVFLLMVPIAFSQGSDKEKNKPEKSKKEKTPGEEDVLSEVRLNFVVLDVAGKPVDGIKAEDLKIFENEKEQKITYFAKKEPVLHLGLVMDNSNSLRAHLPAVMALSKWFAANLKEKDEGFQIRFVSSDKITVLQDWTGDGSLLAKAAEQMYVEGGATAIIDALYLGAEKMLERMKSKESSEKYALLVISDCEDRDSYYKLDDLFAKTKGTDLQIFVLAFNEHLNDSKAIRNISVREKATKFAAKVAAKTGGRVYFPKMDEQNRYTLLPIAQAIMTELRAPYIVGYSPLEQKPEDKKRNLRLEAADGKNGEKRSVFIRDGFFF